LGLWASVHAQDKKPDAPPDRVAAVRHIMSGIHQPNCGAIAGLLKDKGPADAAAWGTLASHAALLNESSYLLMENDRCPDGVWAEAAAALRRNSAALFGAAGDEKLADAREAFKGMTAACAACHTAHKPPPPPELSDRPAAIADLMAGINKPNCGALGAALKDSGPADDEQWHAVARQAALLNEAGHLLMQEGRCPDAAWKNACAALRENASKVVAYAGEKKLDEARSAFKGVTDACGACHKAHRKPPA
jgi:cytochrome c556